MCVCAHVCMCVHMCACVRACACAYAYACVCVRACVRACVHACVHACVSVCLCMVCVLHVGLFSTGTCILSPPPPPPPPTPVAPTLNFQLPPNVTYCPGDQLEFSCSFTGLPQPTVIWQMRDDPDGIFTRINTPFPDVVVDNGANVTVSSMLAFFANNLSPRLELRCEATNTAGTNSDTVELIAREWLLYLCLLHHDDIIMM